jgi:hypothetical protein
MASRMSRITPVLGPFLLQRSSDSAQLDGKEDQTMHIGKKDRRTYPGRSEHASPKLVWEKLDPDLLFNPRRPWQAFSV